MRLGWWWVEGDEWWLRRGGVWWLVRAVVLMRGEEWGDNEEWRDDELWEMRFRSLISQKTLFLLLHSSGSFVTLTIIHTTADVISSFSGLPHVCNKSKCGRNLLTATYTECSITGVMPRRNKGYREIPSYEGWRLKKKKNTVYRI